MAHQSRSIPTISTLLHGLTGAVRERGETEMLRMPNFGCKSLNQIKEVLSSMGLHLGMDIHAWQPENIEEMAKKFEQELLGRSSQAVLRT